MFTGVKRMAEALLVHSGTPRLRRALRPPPGTLVLAYHNIVPRGEPVAGDSSLHLPQPDFAAQLDMLVRHFHVVSVEELINGGAPPDVARPCVVITFDDAYRGAVTAGVHELARRGLPATIFVSPGCSRANGFWWDLYADTSTGGLAPEFRAAALEELRGRQAEIEAYARRVGLASRELPAHARMAAEDEVGEALRVPGITLGSHAWSHANLARLSPVELRDELVRSLEWLRDRFDCVGPWLAYPYGRSSAEAEAEAKAAGYACAFRIDGGRVPRLPTNLHALPRLNVPAGLSLNGFFLRLAGVLRV